MPYLPHRVRGWGRGDQGRLSGRSGSQRDHLPLGEPQSTERDRIIDRSHTTGFYIWAGRFLPLLQRGKDLTEVKSLTNYKTKHNQDCDTKQSCWGESTDAAGLQQTEHPCSVSKVLTSHTTQFHACCSVNPLLHRPHSVLYSLSPFLQNMSEYTCCSQPFAFATRRDHRAPEVMSPCSYNSTFRLFIYLVKNVRNLEKKQISLPGRQISDVLWRSWASGWKCF